MSRTIECLEEASLPPAPKCGNGDGFGVLRTEHGSLPLEEMDVRAHLSGLFSHITIQQTFHNAFDEPLEATYIFPLPDRAAVTSCRMRVAGHIIEAELYERSQARAAYAKAIHDGHRAAIAEEERSGTFTFRVGNIPSKEKVTVELELVGPLPVASGEATFRFPLVVAPRYISGVALDGQPVGKGVAPDTDQAPDASRIAPPVLLPGFPNRVRLSLEVQLEPAGLRASGADWKALARSSLHSVISEDGPPWTIRLQPGERLNRDFVLRFPIATDAMQTSLQFTPASTGKAGTFALTLVPPILAQAIQPQPRDVVFLLDRSGSMAGWKMVAARRSLGRMIDTLLDHDRFTVLAFDSQIEHLPASSQGLIEATNRHRWQTMERLGKLDARGGTELGPALEKALILLSATKSTRDAVLVLITDGQVGAEDMLLKTVAGTAGGNIPRIYTLGIDQAVNAGFLQRLADLGRGRCDLVESEDQLDAAMDRIHRSIGTPILTDVRIESLGTELLTDTVSPSRISDLFADCPVVIYGRHQGAACSLRLRICGTNAHGETWQQDVSGRLGPVGVLESMWGRSRVRELEDRYASETPPHRAPLAQQIVLVSLATHVLSRFTAYVAVDRSQVVNAGGQQHELIQPVEMPAGWAEMPDASANLCYDAVSPTMSPDGAMVKLFASLSPSHRRLRARRMIEDRSPTDHKMYHAATKLARCIEELSRSDASDFVRRSGLLVHLMAIAAEISRLLDGADRGPAAIWDDLVERGRTLLADYVGGDNAALVGARLENYINSCRELLVALNVSSAPHREDPFWA